jgi:hypothetical protein
VDYPLRVSELVHFQVIKQVCGVRVYQDVMRFRFADLVMLVTLSTAIVGQLASETA